MEKEKNKERAYLQQAKMAYLRQQEEIVQKEILCQLQYEEEACQAAAEAESANHPHGADAILQTQVSAVGSVADRRLYPKFD